MVDNHTTARAEWSRTTSTETWPVVLTTAHSSTGTVETFRPAAPHAPGSRDDGQAHVRLGPSLVQDYNVRRLPFDLMGPAKPLMQGAAARPQPLTQEGRRRRQSDILYGEGGTSGEVANDALSPSRRGQQAGTGVGTSRPESRLRPGRRVPFQPTRGSRASAVGCTPTYPNWRVDQRNRRRSRCTLLH